MHYTLNPSRPRLIYLACLVALTPHLALAGSASGEMELPEIVVAAPQTGSTSGGLPRNLSANSSGYSAKEISEQVNVINTEDIVKYSPDTMTRKRYIGDRNAIIETRTASVTSSARSLVYADGFLLSNLLGNSFSYPPRWSMVAPEEVKRVDFFFGPYSAAYAGNSLGTTVIMTTRMPQQFEANGKAQYFNEDFSLYGHKADFSGSNVQASVGNKSGNLSWLLGFSQLDSQGHPMQYVVAENGTAHNASATPPYIAVTGFSEDTNLTGARRLILGETSRDTTHQKTFKLKLAYDFTPTLKGRYWLSSWQNDSYNQVTSYIKDASGNTVTSGRIYDGVSKDYTIASNAFAENVWTQQHWMNALSLKSTSSPQVDWEANATWYRIGNDTQHSSAPDGRCGAGVTDNKKCNTTGTGLATKYYGTEVHNPYGDGWRTLDWRVNWRPTGWDGAGSHEISAGYHYDQYVLDSQTYFTSAAPTGNSWQTAGSNGNLMSQSQGRTQTEALYAQDAWRFAHDWMLTPGLRLEAWKAFGGSNSAVVSTSGTLNSLNTVSYAPRSQSLAMSPKLAIQKATDDNWIYKAAIGRAYRFPTVTELFQSINTGSALTINNPALKPESTNSSELTAEKAFDSAQLRISLFNENLHDALYSQKVTIDGTPGVTTITNVDHVRTNGLTFAFQHTDVVIKGLDMNGSVTYARARTIKNSLVPATEGKVYPGVPDWRATWVGTYHPSDKWAWTLAARYSGDQANQLDNLDVNRSTYTSNSSFLVLDTRVTWSATKDIKLALGVDNLNNETYYAYHPMPMRTVHAELQAKF